MRKLVLSLVVAAGLSIVPTAAASQTVRLTLLHVVQGCHVWATADSRPLGATRTIVLRRGGKIEIRVSCPMAFDVKQIAGPKLTSGPGRWETGTSHTLAFARNGVYKFKALNVQTSQEMNLQTLGPDNTPLLIVRVS
jgi:hypothetical protein